MPAAPSLTQDIQAARRWRAARGSIRKASPGYSRWYPLAQALHTDAKDPWPVMDIARWLKDEHPEAKKALARVTLTALHRALCRHLKRP